MKKAISAIVCLLVAVSVHAGIMDKWADGALEVRQIPGSEQALKDYFAGDSGIIYAVLYPPANCPRCEAMINEAYHGVKKIDKNNKVVLISAYPDRAAAERYNKSKGYVADEYMYDTDKDYLGFLSFSAGYLHVVYILKIDIDNGRIMYGGNFNNNHGDFFRDLTSYDGYAEQHKYGDLVTASGNLDKGFSSVAKPRDIIKLSVPDSITISETNYLPSFVNNDIAMHDKLANACYLFSLDSTAHKASFRAEVKSNAAENKTFVTVPDWYYEFKLEEGTAYFIALSPQITASGRLVVSYSLPELFVQEERDGKLLSVGYKNKSCLVVRDMRDGLKPLPLMPVNNDFSKGYFYKHFTFLAVGDTVILPCQKLTWPIEFDPSAYKGNPERDPFCDEFYEGQNPILAMFDMKTGNLIKRFGNLGEAQARSKTGYYFVNAVAAEHCGNIAYSDGETGHICVARMAAPDSVIATYDAFDFDVSGLPTPDPVNFYSYECAAPYTEFFKCRIEEMRLTGSHIHCLLRYGSHGEAQAGDVYSYVKINLETGRRTETKLDLGGTEAMAYGLRDDNGSISPFAITRHDGENYIEVF